MTFQKSKNPEVNTYLLTIPENIRLLFQKVRMCILETEPDLEEAIKWKNCLTYLSGKENLIQTVLGKEKVSLIFHNGAKLKNHGNLLEGDGAKVRTVRITSLDFEVKALKKLVEESVTMG